MAACLVTHPLDLAKVRLQTASIPRQSLLSMLYSIITKEGFLKIYSGLTASLLRQATYSTARFGIYEVLKEYYIKQSHNKHPSTVVLLPMSMIAGAMGGLVGNPADVVNIRCKTTQPCRFNKDEITRMLLMGYTKYVRRRESNHCSEGYIQTWSGEY